jgi:hypothetical protein
MLQAAHAILYFYKEVAPSLAQVHGIPYPADLERLLVERLEKLGAVRKQSLSDCRRMDG